MSAAYKEHICCERLFMVGDGLIPQAASALERVAERYGNKYRGKKIAVYEHRAPDLRPVRYPQD